MPIMSLFRRRQPHADAARRLFDAIVAQSRRAEFYQHFGVPDTLDGRFDLMVLHVFMVIERLQGEAATGCSRSSISISARWACRMSASASASR
jgi:cytochrome b pre-mRNA-processing protein 3